MNPADWKPSIRDVVRGGLADKATRAHLDYERTRKAVAAGGATFDELEAARHAVDDSARELFLFDHPEAAHLVPPGSVRR